MFRCPSFQLGCSLAVILAGAFSARAEPLLREDFAASCGRYDFLPPQAWKIKDHACRFVPQDRQDGFALLARGEFQTAHVKAELTIDRRQSDGYVMAGLTLYADRDNHWRLILVDSPDGKPYFELTERYEGVHQAQTAAESAGTRLHAQQQATLKRWDYGHSYHLALTLSAVDIRAAVRDPKTGLSWECCYTFAQARAVRTGRLGFSANGVEADFRNLVIDGKLVPSSQSWTAGPRGTAAIVPDEAGRVAPLLQTLLTKDGFGVTILPWRDLARTRLSSSDLDLLVLADARRVPSEAASLASSFLSTRGETDRGRGSCVWRTAAQRGRSLRLGRPVSGIVVRPAPAARDSRSSPKLEAGLQKPRTQSGDSA